MFSNPEFLTLSSLLCMQLFAAGEKVRLDKKQHEEDGEHVVYYELHYGAPVPIAPFDFSLT